MIRTRRWEPCVYHRGTHADTFFRDYLAQADRRLLLIAGAGFDPRSVRVASLLPDALCKSTQVVLIREERPNPSANTVFEAAGAWMKCPAPRYSGCRSLVVENDQYCTASFKCCGMCRRTRLCAQSCRFRHLAPGCPMN